MLTPAPQQFGSIGTGGIPVIIANGKTLEIYFTITPSGNYVAGGDPCDLTAVLNNLQGFMLTTSAIPIQVYIQSQPNAPGQASMYSYRYCKGSTLKNGTVQVALNSAEIGAGAYPANVLADVIVGLAILAIE
jgi:hypothetical protein